MFTTKLKQAIQAEMINGKSLLAAELQVRDEILERLDVAVNEVKAEILAKQKLAAITCPVDPQELNECEGCQ